MIHHRSRRGLHLETPSHDSQTRIREFFLCSFSSSSEKSSHHRFHSHSTLQTPFIWPFRVTIWNSIKLLTHKKEWTLTRLPSDSGLWKLFYYQNWCRFIHFSICSRFISFQFAAFLLNEGFDSSHQQLNNLTAFRNHNLPPLCSPRSSTCTTCSLFA